MFVGTCVPAHSLFDFLEAGDTLEEFLHQFPSVSREQAVAALEYARDQVTRSLTIPVRAHLWAFKARFRRRAFGWRGS